MPIDDRGFHYGDGLFETIACSKKLSSITQHPLWLYHLHRLNQGCEKLCLSYHLDDLIEDINRILAEHHSCIIKIILSRKAMGRGYVAATAETNRFVAAYPFPQFKLSHARVQRSTIYLAQQPQLAGIKHLNRLENVLASKEITSSVDDVLLCDSEGYVIESSKANIFALFDHWITPNLEQCGIKGVVRHWLFDHLPSQGIEVVESNLAYEELSRASALFLTNSVLGILPISHLDGTPMDITAVEPIQHMYNKVWS